METRATDFITVLGTNGTGKSTSVKKLILPYLQTGNRVLVCTPHPEEWLELDHIDYEPEMTKRQAYEAFRSFKTARRLIVDLSNPQKDIENVVNFFRDGMIIFDDCRAYFDAFTPRSLRILQISRRQRMLDIVAVAHAFSEMPPVFFRFFTKMILFKVREHPDKRKSELSEDLHELIPIYDRVQEKSISNPHYFEIYERK
jgi:hypothetical protein